VLPRAYASVEMLDDESVADEAVFSWLVLVVGANFL